MLKIAKRINIPIIFFEYLVLLLQDLSGCITSDNRKNGFIIGCSGGLVMISDVKLLRNDETFPMHPILLAEGQFVYISVDEETKALIYVIISDDVMM